MEYYFSAPALPPLQLGVPPELSLDQLQFLLEMNLKPSDFEKVKVLRTYFDLENLRNLWLANTVDARGNYDKNALEERIITGAGFPQYVFTFLDQYESTAARLSHFSQLMADYFHEEMARAEGFLFDFLQFEREWRLVLLVLRAKQMGKDLIKELQFEDVNDPFILSILAQKDGENYEPPKRFTDLKALFEEYADQPLELHKALSRWRFNYLEEMYGVDTLSIGRILVYLAQLILCEEWMALQVQKEKGDRE